MKTRNGFVSNSSSSSFVCVLTKDDHNKILSKLSAEHQALMEKTCEDGAIGPLAVVGFGNMSDRGGETSYSGGLCTYDSEVKWDELYDAESAYKKQIAALGIKTFNMSFDM